MITNLTKLTVTNSVNDNVNIEWGFFNSEEEKRTWKDRKLKEQDKWNHHTNGAVSYRYYDFCDYETEDVLKMKMDELQGMTVKEFFNVIKNFKFL